MNLQVGKGALPPLLRYTQDLSFDLLSVIKASGGKPPFLTCKVMYLETFPHIISPST